MKKCWKRILYQNIVMFFSHDQVLEFYTSKDLFEEPNGDTQCIYVNNYLKIQQWCLIHILFLSLVESIHIWYFPPMRLADLISYSFSNPAVSILSFVDTYFNLILYLIEVSNVRSYICSVKRNKTTKNKSRNWNFSKKISNAMQFKIDLFSWTVFKIN